MAGCCSYKLARRCLLAINVLNFILGLAFIGVGAVALQKAEALKVQMDAFCTDQCGDVGCADAECPQVETLIGCACGNDPITTEIWFGVFTAPGAGLIAVGIFSIVCALFGLAGAVRATAACLLAYAIFMCFIIILQLGFGAAGAAIERPASLNLFQDILTRDIGHIDWSLFGPVMPYACVASSHSFGEEGAVFSPACTFAGRCSPAGTDFSQTDWVPAGTSPSVCCQDCAQADIDNNACFCKPGEYCISGEECMYAAMRNIGGPVAGLALATLIFEILAVMWACIVWRKARSGDTGGGSKDVPMDNM